MSFLLPYFYQSLGVSETEMSPQVGNGGLMADMPGGEIAMLLMGIMVWAVIAVATTCAGFGIYMAICKINGRWGYVKRMFKGGTRERLISISLILGILITFAFMGFTIYLEYL